MPQLQIKIPTLRRWGKKMAVVVDRAFFDSIGEMIRVADISNADIAWFIVRFDEKAGERRSHMVLDEVRLTTLERSVEGLTGGSLRPSRNLSAESQASWKAHPHAQKLTRLVQWYQRRFRSKTRLLLQSRTTHPESRQQWSLPPRALALPLYGLSHVVAKQRGYRIADLLILVRFAPWNMNAVWKRL